MIDMLIVRGELGATIKVEGEYRREFWVVAALGNHQVLLAGVDLKDNLIAIEEVLHRCRPVASVAEEL